MSDADTLTNRGFALAEVGQVYVVYLPNGGSPNVNLAAPGTYEVLWYNSRDGGDLQQGSVTAEVNAGNAVSLGNPPNNSSSEWVALARRSNTTPGDDQPPSANNDQPLCVPTKTHNGAVSVICL